MTDSLERGPVRVINGRGVAAQVPNLVTGARTLVVASEGTMHRLGLADLLPPGTGIFTDFQPNPTVGQALQAAQARRALEADTVLGIGGGSALDVAKAARALPCDPLLAANTITGRLPVRRGGVRLVLVPTTAGTGSEVTRFATLYQGGRKVSLDADGVQADIAIVDPELSDSCPPDLTWSCAFDAMAHAIESLWSVRANATSRSYAEAALTRLRPVLSSAGPVPTASKRDLLSEAGTLAGRAIDITRTTAAHALAYPLTAYLGIPHGLASALNLSWLVPMVEPSAASAVDRARAALSAGPIGLGEFVRGLIATRCPAVRERARCVDPSLVARIVDEGLASNRMSGTPVRLDRDEVQAAMAALLGSS